MSEISRLTRRALLTGTAAALAGGALWEWIRTRRQDNGTPWPLRAGLDVDQQLAEDYFRPTLRAPLFPASAAEPGRTNGDIGIEDDPDPDWRLQFAGQSLRLEEIQSLPKQVMTTELKCIEGWSRIIQWGGARFQDFAARFSPKLPKDGYVALETPDGNYYVGLDLASAMHPQTLLCYEMNGEPLEPENGAPLRLVIPLKYGIKNLKRIGKIDFTQSRPKDYWAEQGYDYYAGF